MVEEKIVTGYISPIKRKDLLLHNLAPDDFHEDAITYTEDDEDDFVLDDIKYFKACLYNAEREARQRGLIK